MYGEDYYRGFGGGYPSRSESPVSTTQREGVQDLRRLATQLRAGGHALGYGASREPVLEQARNCLARIHRADPQAQVRAQSVLNSVAAPMGLVFGPGERMAMADALDSLAIGFDEAGAPVSPALRAVDALIDEMRLALAAGATRLVGLGVRAALDALAEYAAPPRHVGPGSFGWGEMSSLSRLRAAGKTADVRETSSLGFTEQKSGEPHDPATALAAVASIRARVGGAGARHPSHGGIGTMGGWNGYPG